MCVWNIAVYPCGYWEWDALLICPKKEEGECGQDDVSFRQVRSNNCRLCDNIKDLEQLIEVEEEQLSKWKGLEDSYEDVIGEINQEIMRLQNELEQITTVHDDRRMQAVPQEGP